MAVNPHHVRPISSQSHEVIFQQNLTPAAFSLLLSNGSAVAILSLPSLQPQTCTITAS
jgi:hypothetical protein